MSSSITSFDWSLFDQVESTFNAVEPAAAAAAPAGPVAASTLPPGHIRIKIRIVSKPPSNGVTRRPRMRRQIRETESAQPIVAQKQERMDNTLCIYCGETNAVISDSELGKRLCTKCGTEQGGILDEGQEWRAHSDDTSDPSRCGYVQNPLLSGNLSTMIRIRKIEHC
jgi:hypothetical protein